MADLLVIDEQESIKENEPINVLNDQAKTTKLTDFDKIAILEAVKNSPCLWKSGESWAKNDKQEAVDSISTEFCLTNDGLKKLLHSLRTSMTREIKRSQEQEDYESKWKFFKHMKFLEDEIVKDLQQEPDWTEDETMTIIEFYHTNPVLWNHCLSEYKDRNLKKMAMDKLTTTLNRSEEEIKNHWEDKRQKASKKSGTSTSEVYKSNWKYFDCLRFVRDCAEVDMSKSTLNIGEGTYSKSKENTRLGAM